MADKPTTPNNDLLDEKDKRERERQKEAEKGPKKDEVDEASDKSFPASDPPSFRPTTGRGG